MTTRNFILGIVLSVLIGSCGSSSQISKGKEHKVDNFTHISSSSGIDVYFTQGDKHTVKLEASEEILDHIQVNVEDGYLMLSLKKTKPFLRISSIKAYVTAKNITSIAMSGGADFYADDMKSKNDFSVAASGGSGIEIIKLKTEDCKIAISGGSDCDISNLDTKYLKIAASGGSDSKIYIHDAEDVKASASGGADVILSGKTKKVSISCSGGADANIRQLTYDKIDSSKSGGGSVNK